MSRLLNLETLDINGCRSLGELQIDIGSMVSLRHLIIGGCESLSDMPNGLGRLISLRTLPVFLVSRTELNNFGRHLSIKNLGDKQKAAG